MVALTLSMYNRPPRRLSVPAQPHPSASGSARPSAEPRPNAGPSLPPQVHHELARRLLPLQRQRAVQAVATPRAPLPEVRPHQRVPWHGGYHDRPPVAREACELRAAARTVTLRRRKVHERGIRTLAAARRIALRSRARRRVSRPGARAGWGARPSRGAHDVGRSISTG